MGKFIDLTGQKIGELTVENIVGKNKHGQSIWLCKCSCGNSIELSTSNLRNGSYKSCGCYKSTHKPHNFNDLTGMKFGKLTVLKQDKTLISKGKHILTWLCKCDCGNEITVRGAHLKNNHTTSCGCIMSVGEEKISNILIENNITFCTQKTYKDLKGKNNTSYRFDFYILDGNYLIEFDGIQHYKEWDKYNSTLQETQERDMVKNNYCVKNNIPLIRIPYTRYNKLCIDDLKLETSNFIYKGVA